MDITIRLPQTKSEWEDYYDLRYRILRKPLGKPRGSEKDEGDETGIHFALYHEGELRAIARLDEVDLNLCQVRYVAVENNQQGKGYGKVMMYAVEQEAEQIGYDKIILHARENALDFYLKLEYINLGESYLLFDQIQHFKMEKEL